MIMEFRIRVTENIKNVLNMKKIYFSVLIVLSFFLLSNSFAQEKTLDNFYNQFPDPYTKTLESIFIQGDVTDVVVEEDEIIFNQEQKVSEVVITEDPEPIDDQEDEISETRDDDDREDSKKEKKTKSALDIIADALESQNKNNVQVLEDTPKEMTTIKNSEKNLVPSDSLFDFEIVERNKFIEENLSSDISKFVIIAIAMKSSPDLDHNYIVKKGDTLSSIAKKFDLTLDELIAANPNIVPNKIKEGSKINIFSPPVIYSNKFYKDTSMSSEDNSGFELGSYWVELSTESSKKAIEEKISYYRRSFEDIFYGKTIRVRPRNEMFYVIEVGPYSKSLEADDVVSLLNYRFQYAKKNKVMDLDVNSSNNYLNITGNSSDNRRGKNMALVTTPSGNIIKVYEGDHLGNDDSRIIKILPDKIILSKLGSEVNLYFSKSRRSVLENNDGFRDNILADEYFDPTLYQKPETSEEQVTSLMITDETFYTEVSDEVLNAGVCAGGSLEFGKGIYYNPDKGCLDPTLEGPMLTKTYSRNADGEIVEGLPDTTGIEDFPPTAYVYDAETNSYQSSLGTISLEVDEAAEAQFDENIRLSSVGDISLTLPEVDPLEITEAEVVSESTSTSTLDLDEYISQGGDVSAFTDMGLTYDEATQTFTAETPEEFLSGVSCSTFEVPAECEAAKTEYGIE